MDVEGYQDPRSDVIGWGTWKLIKPRLFWLQRFWASIFSLPDSHGGIRIFLLSFSQGLLEFEA